MRIADPELIKDLYKLSKGLPDDANVDGRKLRFWGERLSLRLLARQIYMESPLAFHHPNKRFVAELLFDEIKFRFETDDTLRAQYKVRGDKALRAAIRKAKAANMFPKMTDIP